MKKQAINTNLAKKALQLSLQNIWRNRFLSVITVFVIGTIIFIFNTILAINMIAQDSLSELNKKIDITVYLKESTTPIQTQELINGIDKLEGVTKISYTSKLQALDQIKTTHPDITLAFEKFELGNPLPSSISITTEHPKYHAKINSTLSQDKYQIYLSTIVTSKTAIAGGNPILTSISKNLLEVTNFTNQIIFWLVLIFVIGGTLIILNTIQVTIFNRKKEIEVMKMVGAPLWFIRLPYILESIIYGLAAIVLSYILLLILSQTVEIKETSLFSYYSQISLLKIFLAEIAVTTILSISSASVAVHEYLK